MKDEIKKFLFDIKEASNSIFEYLGDERDFLHIMKTKCCVEPLNENLR